MGKRKKNKHRTKYSLNDFKTILCSKCGVCDNNSEPEYCYRELYKDNPTIFVGEIYPKLKKLGKFDITALLVKGESGEKLFNNIFCTADICGYYNFRANCPLLGQCMDDFGSQVIQVTNSHSFTKPKTQEKYIVQPYPTFFCRNKEIWDKRIKEALG